MSKLLYEETFTARQIYAVARMSAEFNREMAFTKDITSGKILASTPNLAVRLLEDDSLQHELKCTKVIGREFYTQLVEYVVEPLIEKLNLVYLRVGRVPIDEHPYYVDYFNFYVEGDVKPFIRIRHDVILNSCWILNTNVRGKHNIRDKILRTPIVTPNLARIPRWSCARKLWYQRLLCTRIDRAYKVGCRFSVKNFAVLNRVSVKSNKLIYKGDWQELVFRHLDYLTSVKGYYNLVCQFDGATLNCYEQNSKVRIVSFILDDGDNVVDIEYLYYGFRYCRCSSNVFSEGQPFGITLAHLPPYEVFARADLNKLDKSMYLPECVVD